MVNKYCESANIFPIFPNPDDVVESTKTYVDITTEYPESELNKFFGVERKYDYKPPVYTPPEGPEKER